MAKETRKQLPFDRDAINENLAWRIPLVLRICVHTDAAWPSERQGIEYLQLDFLSVGSNCQFG